MDLGASPGGWAFILLQFQCHVIAVESPLHPILMDDDGVEFVQWDAFAFTPPFANTKQQQL